MAALVVQSYAQQKGSAKQWQVDGITAALDDPLPGVPLRALREIGTFRSFKGIPVSQVAPLLRDPDPNTRSAAVSALGAMAALDQAGDVVRLLKDPNAFVRSAAASALGEMKAMDQVGELVKLLRDPNPEFRSSAASALGALRGQNQAGEISRLLNDPQPFVRSAAASALGAMEAKDQASEVAKLLEDHEPLVRAASASALGAMQANDQARKVAALLRDPVAFVPIAAASALGAMKANDLAGEVVKLLQDSNSDVRSAAASALGAMQARDQSGEVIKLLKDPAQYVRSAAASALGAMQATDRVEQVAMLLKDSDPDVRSAAASALGAMLATDRVEPVAMLLGDPDPAVRGAAASALGAMQATSRAGAVVTLLTDLDPNVRIAAVSALGAMQAKNQAREVVQMLQDPAPRVRRAAASALGDLAPLPRTVVPSLSESYYFNHAEQVEIRFQCYYLTGADPSVKLLLRRIMFEGDKPDQQVGRFLSAEQTLIVLQTFHELLPAKPRETGFAADAEKQILKIARESREQWSPSERALLVSLGRQVSPDSAAALREIVQIPWWQTAFKFAWRTVAVQIAFWILLLYFYPTSTQVQAFFFWNRWARKFFGLGYVDLCLTWIPFLRNRLLAPFREELLADARVRDKVLEEYFDDVQAQEGEERTRLNEAIPQVVGQIVLEGESGLGKSMFLRRLVRNTDAAIAYFPAENCDQGVFELIQLRLKGKASDESFLKSIIWSGGLRIVVDGLNAVTVETREKIRRFLDDFPKAHVLLTTQPMLWKRPPKARELRLLPLSDDRILSFLTSRYASFSWSGRSQVAMSEDEYKAKCQEYLKDVLGPAHSEEERAGARLVLSNPMDLTTAAQILASGDVPTLTNLQGQQFRRMSREFRDTHPGEEFPLKQFSESVYERLLRDEIALDSAQFFEPIQAMAIHKMALEQHDTDAEGKPTRRWVFRHDKIRDYFLVQAFGAQEDERILKHIDDPRFRGVYLMLASQLPIAQARDLRDALVDRAAETKDHHLSDAVVGLLKTRRLAALHSVG